MKLMMFAKSLQEYSIEEAGRALQGLGIPGMDLTVRSNGYVQREDVKEGLPAAVATLEQVGIEVPMLTTDITSADEDHVEDVFATAAECGVQWIKLGYWHYEGFGTLEKSVYEAQAKMVDLEAIAKQYGVWAGLHIHSGDDVTANGAVVWEILRGRNPEHVGAYIDPGHMVVEGARSGWKLCMDLLGPWIKLVAIKDVRFEHNPTDDNPKNFDLKLVPLAEGMVQWAEVFELLAGTGFDGGIIMHSEYKGGYSFRCLNTDEVVEQTREDMAYLRPILEQYWPV